MKKLNYSESTGVVFSCKGCVERVPGCHSTCEKYKVEKEEHTKKTTEIREQRKTEFKIKMAGIAAKRRRLEYERNKH